MGYVADEEVDISSFTECEVFAKDSRVRDH